MWVCECVGVWVCVSECGCVVEVQASFQLHDSTTLLAMGYMYTYTGRREGMKRGREKSREERMEDTHVGTCRKKRCRREGIERWKGESTIDRRKRGEWKG